MEDVAALTSLLDAHLGTPAAYHVRSVYLTRQSRKGEHRIRARYYNSDPTSWLECKRTTARSHVVKRRTRSRGDLPTCWERRGTVNYARRAWERDSIRVTIDEGVERATGDQLSGYVVEVKGPRVPKWLRAALPKQAKGFSKRKWALSPPDLAAVA